MQSGALGVAVAVAIEVAVFAQTPDKPDMRNSRPDTIVVRGCVSGSLLTDLRERKTEALSGAETPMVYRLTGNKKQLQQMQKTPGDVLDVTGILRSGPNSSGLARSKEYGKARVFVGAGSQTTSDPAKPSMPSLRVTSFEVVGPGCRS